MEIELACDIDQSVLNSVIEDLKTLDKKETVIFDFKKTGFFSSFAITFFLIILNDLCRNHKVWLQFSKDTPLLYYLSRMGFFGQLNEAIVINPQAARDPKYIEPYRKLNDTILEITPITRIEIAGAIEHIFNTMTNVLGYDCHFAGNIAILLSELLNNVIDHSQNVSSGFVSLQTYRRAKYVEISVVDSGIGIYQSLKENQLLALNNDIDGILHAVRKGISRFPGQNRGFGLHTCLQLTKENQGSLYIRSGSGEFLSWKRKINTARVSYFQGTQVAIKLPYLKSGRN
ncbi:MAG TPA: sensor histidine kinase [Syntrophothermus lipocalidus]|nr:sensor histidine kinase [Syntrophothermus lipocalidus]